eukprot:TRINITY_DN33874_c0_g1_i1.p1 TRINITY_DN33874_c0_g1~~TRINITY_DN33874_c0_g1_i1.p1  ORF type:complete len:1805 (+),score=190.01 TRINITY_DN33874_c0_g1_i1:559-5973(+)
MACEAQIYAAWRWLRWSNSADPRCHLLPSHRSVHSLSSALGAADGPGVALLYSSACIAHVHPHRLRRWRCQLIDIFVSSLLRRLARAWRARIHLECSFLASLRNKAAAKVYEAWKSLSAARSWARRSYDKLRLIRLQRSRHVFLRLWRAKQCRISRQRSGCKHVSGRRQLQLCRETFAIWQGARLEKMRLLTIHNSLQKKLHAALMAVTFKALVAWRPRRQQSAVLAGLSRLLRRKTGLRQALKHLRERALRRSQARAVHLAHVLYVRRDFIQRWHSAQQSLGVAQRRDIAARRWATAKLSWRVYQAWFQAAKRRAFQRRQIDYLRRERAGGALLTALQNWFVHAYHLAQMCRAREAATCNMAAYRRSRGLLRWRTNIEAAKFKRQAREDHDAHVATAVLQAWRAHAEQALDVEIQMVGTLIVLRFRHMLRAWYNRVVVRRKGMQLRSRRRMEQRRWALHLISSHTKERHYIRSQCAVLTLRSRLTFLGTSLQAWSIFTKNWQQRRLGVDQACRRFFKRRLGRLIAAWRHHCQRRRELAKLEDRIGRYGSSRRLLGAFQALLRAAAISIRGRRLQDQASLWHTRWVFTGWILAVRRYVRCRTAAAELTARLPRSRRVGHWKYWRVRVEGRRLFRQKLADYRSGLVMRRLRICFSSWQDAVNLKKRLDAFTRKLTAGFSRAAQRLALRQLAIWCVHRGCVEHSLRRFASVLSTVALRGALAAVRECSCCHRQHEELLRRGASFHLEIVRYDAFQHWLTATQNAHDERQKLHWADGVAASRTCAVVLVGWRAAALKERRLLALTCGTQERLETSRMTGVLRAWWHRYYAARKQEERLHEAVLLQRSRSLQHAWQTWLLAIWKAGELERRLEHLAQRRGLRCGRRSQAMRLSGRVCWEERAEQMLRLLAAVSVSRQVLMAWHSLQVVHAAEAGEVQQFEALQRQRLLRRVLAALGKHLRHMAECGVRATQAAVATQAARALLTWKRSLSQATACRGKAAQLRQSAELKEVRFVFQAWMTWQFLQKTRQLLGQHLQRRCQQRRLSNRLYTWVAATVAIGRAKLFSSQMILRAAHRLLLLWKGKAVALKRQRQVLNLSLHTTLHPCLRHWRIATACLQTAAGYLRAICRSWAVAAHACARGRRTVEGALLERRTAALRGALAQLHWNAGRRTQQEATTLCQRLLLTRWLKNWRLRSAERRRHASSAQTIKTIARRTLLSRALNAWSREQQHSSALALCSTAALAITTRSLLLAAWASLKIWVSRQLTEKTLASLPHRERCVLQDGLASWSAARQLGLAERSDRRRWLQRVFAAWFDKLILGGVRLRATVWAAHWETADYWLAFKLGLQHQRHLRHYAERCKRRSESRCCRLALFSWRVEQLRCVHLVRLLPLAAEASRRPTLEAALRAWESQCAQSRRVARAGETIRLAAQSRLLVLVLSAWLALCATRRLARCLEKLENRCKELSLQLAMRRLVEGSRDFTAAWKTYAARCPRGLALFEAFVSFGAAVRTDALQEWLTRTRCNKQQRQQLVAYRTELRRRVLERALKRLAAHKARRTTLRRAEAAAERFQKEGKACLEAAAWQAWIALTRELAWERDAQASADALRHKLLIWSVMRSWVLYSARMASCWEIAAAMLETSKLKSQAVFLTHWQSWSLQIKALRLATMTCVNTRARRLAKACMDCWTAAARLLVEQETLKMLRADDFRKRQHQSLLLCISSVWYSTVADRIKARRSEHLAAVFTSWRLHTEEQLLLRKYLQECSSAQFHQSIPQALAADDGTPHAFPAALYSMLQDVAVTTSPDRYVWDA